MSASPTPPAPLAASLERSAWPWWVRAQVWSGIIPLAGYLVLHLAAQAFVWGGGGAYERAMRVIDGAPGMAALEVLVIYAPLAVHAGVGVWRLLSESTLYDAGWAGRSGWRLQHASGALLLVFLVVHGWQFRWRLWSGELARSDFYPLLCESLSSTTAYGVPLMALFYLCGVGAAAFHAAHGLFHAGQVLGWATGDRAVWLGRACFSLGLLLFAIGAAIVVDLATGSVLIQSPFF